MLIKTLKWPVVSLFLTGSVHLLVEFLLPDLRNLIVPPVVAMVLFVHGSWVGYRMVQNGGHLGQVIAGGALLGLFPFTLQVVGFGILLGRGLQPSLVAGVFGFTMLLWGSLFAGGATLQARPASVAQTEAEAVAVVGGARQAVR